MEFKWQLFGVRQQMIQGTLWTKDTIYIPISWWGNFKTYDTNTKFIQQRTRAKTSGQSLVLGGKTVIS
jgi:hypothetical protein